MPSRSENLTTELEVAKCGHGVIFPVLGSYSLHFVSIFHIPVRDIGHHMTSHVMPSFNMRVRQGKESQSLPKQR